MGTTLETKNNSNLKYNDTEEETSYASANQLISSCAVPMALKVTIDMGVLQMIHDQAGTHGLSPAEIATGIQIRNPDAPTMLDRMLWLLATHSVVRCTVVHGDDGGVERRYSSSPMTKYMVPDDDGVSLAAMLNLFTGDVYHQSWSKLREAIEEGGIPFNKAHGMSSFEYPSVDPRYNDVFNKAMFQTTTFIIKKIMEKYKVLESIHQLVDVGGSLGHTLGVITSQYPSLKGINFDLPHVIKNAHPYPGVEHVGGDMFESIPKGDAIFLKWILHDWSDEHCLKLLKNCYKALPDNGKVIVVETIVLNEPETSSFARLISQVDLYMMTQLSGGKERNMQEYETLAKAAGFSTVKLACSVYHFWVIELYK